MLSQMEASKVQKDEGGGEALSRTILKTPSSFRTPSPIPSCSSEYSTPLQNTQLPPISIAKYFNVSENESNAGELMRNSQNASGESSNKQKRF